MKNKWLFLFYILFAVGCSESEVVENPPQPDQPEMEQEDKLIATFERVTSRMEIQDETLLWSAGDELLVYSKSGNSLFKIQGGEGQASAEFTGKLPKNPVGVLLNSAELSPSLKDSCLSITLPSTIKNLDKCSLPMWTSWSGNQVILKHLTGLLAVSMKNVPTNYNRLHIASSEVITGAFQADISQSEIMLVPASDNENNKEMSLDFQHLVDADHDMIYLPLPVGTYSTLKISVSDGTDEFVLKQWKNLEIKRADLYPVSCTYLVIDGTTPSDVSNALDNELDVQDNNSSSITDLSAQIDFASEIVADENSIVIPASVEEHYADITLNFLEKPVTTIENPLKIEQNSTAEVGESSYSLSVNMPADADIEHLDIKTPRASIILNGGKYRQMTVTSALNTFVVSADVTIDNLVVKGGNIRILKGGKITGSITRSSENITQTFIILEDGINKEEALPSGFSSNDDFCVVYESEYELRQRIRQQAKVTLAKNVVLCNPMEISSPINLDLNGCSILNPSGDVFVVVSGGNLMLEDDNHEGIVECAAGQHVVSLRGGNASVYGGTYKGKIRVETPSSQLKIVGGMFYGFNPRAYVPDEFEVIRLDETMEAYEVRPADWLQVSEGIYEIYTTGGMRQFASMFESGNDFHGITIRLARSINMKNEQWVPIGTEAMPFKGTFDGQGFAIKNLQVYSDEKYVGMFAVADGATFKNLRIEGGEVKGGGQTGYVGALVAHARGVIVINCHNLGCRVIQQYSKESGKAGGLAGGVYKSETRTSIFIACSNTGEVHSSYCPAGIMGGGFGAGTTIVACYNLGNIFSEAKGRMFASGIVADFGGGNNMTACFTDCTIPKHITNGAIIGDVMTNTSDIHYSYSANLSMKLIGQVYAELNSTVGYASYQEAVPYLNKGIEEYNWTALIPCEYTFAEGKTPSLVYTKPSSDSGMGADDWGNGGIF